MALKEQIQEDLKHAMRAKDQRRVGVIRLLLAAIKQREVDERIILDDTQILSVISKMLKQRHDSIDQYQQAGRQDLVDQELFEKITLEHYLPEQLSDSDIDDLVKQALYETGAQTMKDMSKVMSLLKPRIQGRADMAEISKKIKQTLETKKS